MIGWTHVLPLAFISTMIVAATPQTYRPTFLTTPTTVTYHVGQEAVLPCAVENKGTRTITWRKISDKNPLTIDEMTYIGDHRFSVTHQTHSLKWNLVIKEVRLTDQGVYVCKVNVKNRDVKLHVTLIVDETPYRKPRQSKISINGSRFVERGDTMRLSCNATGSDYPPDDIDWFKDGDVIRHLGRVTLTKDVSLSDGTIRSVLEIRRSQMEDGGTYVCRTSDLQVTSAKVNILNTETSNNEKRESFSSTTYQHNNDVTSSSGLSRPSEMSICFLLLLFTWVKATWTG